jgi:hypothetical protein
MLTAVVAITLFSSVATADEHEHEHYDIAPYFQDGQLLTGGLDHGGHHTPPPITAYGFEFGEDPFDPFNPSDPGVNQAAGVGGLPAGAALSYNILSSLLYWDGSDEVAFGSPGDAYVSLLMGTQSRILDADSGAQTGSYIQAVLSDGSVHKHFTTSLYAATGAGNVPGIGDSTYVEPTAGIYAFSLELVLNNSGTVYTSDPIWAVFNNGLDEHAHHEAMEHLVPEPASLSLLAMGGLALLRRKRTMQSC